MDHRNKAQALVSALREANQRIVTAERENRETKTKVHDLYRLMVSIKLEAAKNSTAGESIDYPQVATEDLAELRPVQLLHNTGSLVSSLMKNMSSVRRDYREITAGLEEADAALDEWQTIRIGGSQEEIGRGFRSSDEAKNDNHRPETPDAPLARPSNNKPVGHPIPMPISPPDSTTKGQEGSAKPTISSPIAAKSSHKTSTSATGKNKK